MKRVRCLFGHFNKRKFAGNILETAGNSSKPSEASKPIRKPAGSYLKPEHTEPAYKFAFVLAAEKQISPRPKLAEITKSVKFASVSDLFAAYIASLKI